DGHIPSSLGHLSHHLSVPDQRGSRLLALKTAKEAGRPLLHRLFTQARSLTNLASAPNFTDVRRGNQVPAHRLARRKMPRQPRLPRRNPSCRRPLYQNSNVGEPWPFSRNLQTPPAVGQPEMEKNCMKHLRTLTL